jgi:hypothetical protein
LLPARRGPCTVEAPDKYVGFREPRPLALRRREPVLAQARVEGKATAGVVVADVYADKRSLEGVKRGQRRFGRWGSRGTRSSG